MNDDRMRDIAELEIRRYLDSLMADTLPKMVEASIRAHNFDPEAHGRVERRFNRILWIAIGLAASGGGLMGSLIPAGVRMLVG